MTESQQKKGPDGATNPSPADFPLGSLESRAAARLRLQGLSAAGKNSPLCTCFPDDEQPFFPLESWHDIAAELKCPLHGDRFKPKGKYHSYVATWRWENEVTKRWPRLSAQFHKAWRASFPPGRWPEDEAGWVGAYSHEH